jgi:hypothetical protein
VTALCGFEKVGDFQKAHRQWLEHALENGRAPRDERWSEAIAVGSLSFVNTVKSELGFKAAHPDSGWFKPFKPFNPPDRVRGPFKP